MRDFCRLLARPSATAIADYFATVPAPDRMAALQLLVGRRPARLAPKADITAWGCSAAGLPDWLFDATAKELGDPFEVAALSLPDGPGDAPLSEVVAALDTLRAAGLDQRQQGLADIWARLTGQQRLVVNRLACGTAPAVDRAALLQGLAQATGCPPHDVAWRLAGNDARAGDNWQDFWHRADAFLNAARPLPPAPVNEIGDTAPPLSGARPAIPLLGGPEVQLVLRPGHHYLWSHSGDLLSNLAPALAPLADFLPPDTVLTGELALDNGAQGLRPATGLDTARARPLAGLCLVVLDVLQLDGVALSHETFATRMQRLRQLAAGLPDRLPWHLPTLSDDPAAARARLRDSGQIALRMPAPDAAGFLQWPAPPLTLTAVLTTVTTGSAPQWGMALARGNRWVRIAAVTPPDPGADPALAARLAPLIGDRFGPARAVSPGLVFRIAYDGLIANSRRDAGLELLRPRLDAWLPDADISDASDLDSLRPGAS